MTLAYTMVTLFMMGTSLPVWGLSPETAQTVYSAPAPSSVLHEQQSFVANFSAPFNPRNYETFQHMARCTGINRSIPGKLNVKEIHLREFHLHCQHRRILCTLAAKQLFDEWPESWLFSLRL